MARHTAVLLSWSTWQEAKGHRNALQEVCTASHAQACTQTVAGPQSGRLSAPAEGGTHPQPLTIWSTQQKRQAGEALHALTQRSAFPSDLESASPILAACTASPRGWQPLQGWSASPGCCLDTLYRLAPDQRASAKPRKFISHAGHVLWRHAGTILLPIRVSHCPERNAIQMTSAEFKGQNKQLLVRTLSRKLPAASTALAVAAVRSCRALPMASRRSAA